MFPQAPQATVHLLERLGHQVFFPESQGCCGQMHVNTGYFSEAVGIVKNHMETFQSYLMGSAMRSPQRPLAFLSYWWMCSV